MRLSLALSALAAFALAGATAAQADTPPAAPIFYCPTPGKADPPLAAARTKPAAHTGHVSSAHRRHGCPVAQVAAEHRHGHPHTAATTTVVAQKTAPHQSAAGSDVSASQAFIYRYERALHGLDARAAEEAWAEGRHPHPDRGRHDGPPVEGPVLAHREVPPPPCPHRCPGPDAWGHDGQPDIHAYAQSAPVPAVEERPLPAPVERVQPPPPPVPAPPRPHRAYAWQDDHSGYRTDERAEESERAGGWRYSEVDGQGHYQHWGDHFAGEPAWNDRDDRTWDDRDAGWRDDGRRDDGDERYRAAPRYRCPPPVPASSCAAGPDAPVRHSDAAVAGRDSAGYLTWPGKTE
jgi:hypothetical protein